MTKVHTQSSDANGTRLCFRCPGCNEAHTVLVGSPNGWRYNGNPWSPTFTPSVKVSGVRLTAEAEAMIERGEKLPPGVDSYPHTDEICHSYVTDGRIQFLNDSTHTLAGQTVDLPPWEKP